MIVPILCSFKKFRGNFLVWWLCGGLLVLHLIFTLEQKIEPSWDTRFLMTTGEFYQVWRGIPAAQIDRNPLVLQNFAVRSLFDRDFRQSFDRLSKRVDPIRFKQWRSQFMNEVRERDESLVGRVGVLAHEPLKISRLISYGFFHLNFFHLFSNLIFLFVFAAALERKLGSLTLLAVFLITNMAGGLGYWLTSEPGHPPMIGASAAVSGLMAFYLFTERRKVSRFFYFLYPDQKGFGDIVLSKFFLIPLYFMSDLTALMTSVDSFSGVAYVAHLSGFAAGSLLALAFSFLPRVGQSLGAWCSR